MTADTSRTPPHHSPASVFVERREELKLIASRIVRHPDSLDDILQDTYVKLAISAPLQEVLNPFGYCCQAVRNMAFDYHRRRSIESGLIQFVRDESLPEACDEREAYAGIDERRVIEHIDATLATLPERSQLVFQLHRVHGKTQREIGRMVGVSATLVNFMLKDVMQALAPLRELLCP